MQTARTRQLSQLSQLQRPKCKKTIIDTLLNHVTCVGLVFCLRDPSHCCKFPPTCINKNRPTVRNTSEILGG